MTKRQQIFDTSVTEKLSALHGMKDINHLYSLQENSGDGAF
jgi:hypothetical protein